MAEPFDEYPELRLAPLLKGLDNDLLARIFAAGTTETLQAGDTLFAQGEPAKRFYLVVDGRLRLSQVTANGQQVVIRFLTPGQILAIVAALGHEEYPATAEAVEPTKLIGWGGEAWHALMAREAALGVNVVSILTTRIQEMQDRFRELATENVERRVARGLLRLIRQAGRRVEGGVLIDMQLTRQELAEMTGTTLYSVSRILTQWETDGIVRTDKRRVLVRAGHRLVAIAEDLPEDLLTDDR